MINTGHFFHVSLSAALETKRRSSFLLKWLSFRR